MSENQEQTNTKNNVISDYIEKNNNLLTILVIPVIGILASIMLYSYYHGMYSYFKISEIWLDMSSDHSKFYPVFMISIALFILAFNMIPFLVIKYKKPKEYTINNKPKCLPKLLFKKKEKLSLFGGVFHGILWATIIYLLLFCIFYITYQNILQGLILALPVWLMFYGIGFIEGLMSYRNKKHKTEEQEEYDKEARERDLTIGITIIVVAIILEFFCCYGAGYSTAQNKKEFKIIDNSTVILYETQDKFIVAEAEIDEKNNILNIQPKQTIIENTDVTYEIKTFAKVIPPKS